MATYIKGADTYLPDIKPFTPDYKFLSQVVNARQDKYDANFQATNDLYNKVVYADLSRQDTKDRRDQYAQQIGPQIEKISGLDLSLQSNADAAKSVFAPFYQDDLTVRDVVFTSRFRDEMSYANLLLDNPNKEQYEKYWDTGKKGLQYRMEDFVNASEQEAMNMALPKYVEDADLGLLADQILSEMDPPLKRKVDYFETDKKGRPLTDFIITEQNGKQVTGQAEQILRNQLLQNPKVIAAYYEEGFVRSRDFASEGVTNGTFSSISQGKEAWAKETIRRIDSMNTKDTQEKIRKKQDLVNANVNWQNYQANVGILEGPDSTMALAYQDQQEMLDATEASLNASLEMKEIANLPSNTDQALMNKAYNLVMNYNILGDINKSARDYASRDYEYSIRESKYGVIKKQADYASALQSQRDRAADRRQERKYELEYLKGIAEGTINSESQQRIIDAANGYSIDRGSSDTNKFPTDSDGDPDLKNFQPYEIFEQQFDEADAAVHKRQVENIIKTLTITNPTGNVGGQVNTYAVRDEGGNILFEGTPDKLRLQMNAVGKNGLLENRDKVNIAFEDAVKVVKDRRQMILDNPNLSENRAPYDELYGDMITNPQSTENQLRSINAVLEENYKRITQHYTAIDNKFQNETSSKSSDARDGRKAGLGSILNERGGIMTREKFIQQAIKLAEAGQLTNWDSDGPDAGFGVGKDYRGMVETVSNSEIVSNVVPPGSPYIPGSISRTMKINELAVASDAGRYYDRYREALTESMRGDKKYGTLPAISFRGMMEGRGDTFENAYAGTAITYKINPIVKLSPELQRQNNDAVLAFFNQLNSFEGRPYGLIAGSINRRGLDSDELMQKDATAEKVLRMWRKDYAEYLANPQKNPDKPVPAVELIYKRVLGQSDDGDKTNAGWQVVFDEDWLASKRKGSSTDSYGALDTRDINSLKGIVPQPGTLYGEKEGTAMYDPNAKGISLIFPQDQDISEYAVNKPYFSFVETAILESPNDTYTTTVPGDIQTTAEFQVVKDADNIYRMMYKAYNYNPYNPNDKSGGNYIPDVGTMQLFFPKGFSLKELDKKIEAQRKSFEQLRKNNKVLFDLDSKRYGIKDNKNRYLPKDTIVKDNRPVLNLNN